ncbi:MAG TPA: hypothetical protein P5052_00155 [Candidatus Paceibacterota bacterium]|nr:hypothetical protein [Candidatus Paceibacterota bacterium]HRZ29230.1 hypothetical protein [Candidatus Paceibacterota bacterium]
MKNLIKNILVVALILIAVLLMFSNSEQGLIFNEKTKTIAISELVKLINNNQVVELEIKKDNVVIIGKDNHKSIAKINDGESVFELLKFYGVNSEKISNTKVIFKEDIN